ncbi:MAG: redox-sensing transcriptional repressor Rex [Clostridia bacterium]|jgi:redox-sensing transcriptional repressor|nr:redox-sensing transcriptional repressor Rex [Clostridia bacterium]MDE7070848.1 redox-sensing transcriptional repressor Rex [Clostridia bacterium]
MISEAVIKRLPRYYRHIKQLADSGVTRVSSNKIASVLNITASQVRQDLCNFGGFGQQGYGYDVVKLKNELAVILGLDKEYDMIIVGAGNIGRALAGYKGFVDDGFFVRALFDIDPRCTSINGIKVYEMDLLEAYLKQNNVDIAIIATQKDSAKSVADELIKYGVKSIWNFAPVELEVPEGVTVENISMSESLYVLSFRSKNNK